MGTKVENICCLDVRGLLVHWVAQLRRCWHILLQLLNKAVEKGCLEGKKKEC